MGKSWGGITEGIRVEVPNTDSSLPMKVYWIASIIKLAGTCTADLLLFTQSGLSRVSNNPQKI